jgi:hypothetical protein
MMLAEKLADPEKLADRIRGASLPPSDAAFYRADGRPLLQTLARYRPPG